MTAPPRTDYATHAALAFVGGAAAALGAKVGDWLWTKLTTPAKKPDDVKKPADRPAAG